MRGKLSDELVSEIRKYYDAGNSCEKTSIKFNVGKTTVKSYVNVRHKIKLSEEDRRKYRVKSVTKRRIKIKEDAVKYKGGKCIKCGYNKYIGALEFHHINQDEKDFEISNGNCKSWDKIIIELDKCILLCSNCHRELHGNIK